MENKVLEMKKYILFITCLFLLSGCDDLKEVWIIYKHRPHHVFYVDNKSGRQIYGFGSPIGKIGNGHDVGLTKENLLSEERMKYYIYIYDNKRVIDIVERYINNISVLSFDIRYEDIIPYDEDDIIAYIEVFYMSDLYAVYYGKTDVLPYWRYGYTLEDLQRYNWNVPFPDYSGTIKTEKFEYKIKERE